MSSFTVKNTSEDGKHLSVVQRSIRGGSIGSQLILEPDEEAIVTIEASGVQLTVTESPVNLVTASEEIEE